ncbi:hypothetical protein PTSG_12411 [Salpingoeca rosetta]|uniref:Uncharacterized protein n=1 Tax=Salpingoeca rosetta (strain ATCC 50818 / BSB-021) TaxID=946362 RepID=F2UC66_SALR5|nr:uncharacterized protein PTSG_12411 [Salpingoeca rosetta]EGD74173.1 hypothetical protein PTSG_12411 [Salpingoeca rosetta]|eukprot:XP_004993073.1 hypothetical protein PTSG_12411 [Salpingoeca rosetta]
MIDAVNAEASTGKAVLVQNEAGDVHLNTSDPRQRVLLNGLDVHAELQRLNLWNHRLHTGVCFIRNGGVFLDAQTLSGLPPGVDKWRRGVRARNGKIYGIPRAATAVLIIDPASNTYDITTMTGFATDVYKWADGVLAGNGKIYCIPEQTTMVLVIDPKYDVFDASTISVAGYLVSGESGNWEAAVLADNGKIYAVPNTNTHVLVINPDTNTTSTIAVNGADNTNYKWFGAVLARNGKIYGIPYRATSILITDSADATTLTLDGNTGGGMGDNGPSSDFDFGWAGGVLAQNGLIYGIRTTRWAGGVVVDDGRILGVPFSASSVLTIQPTTNSVGLVTSAASFDSTVMGARWFGGVEAEDGRIFAIPAAATSILVIDPLCMST